MSSDAISFVDGKLRMSVVPGEVQCARTAEEGLVSRNFSIASVETWNKFCFTGKSGSSVRAGLLSRFASKEVALQWLCCSVALEVSCLEIGGTGCMLAMRKIEGKNVRCSK